MCSYVCFCLKMMRVKKLTCVRKTLRCLNKIITGQLCNVTEGAVALHTYEVHTNYCGHTHLMKWQVLCFA